MARDFTDILSAVWAANALTTIPNPPIPGQAYRNTAITDGDLSNGQQYSEVYDSARYNQLLYLLSGCVKMLMETGIPEWSAEQNYQQNAYTIGSDGKLYGPAKKASGPDNSGAVDPVTDAAGEATTWTLSLPDFEAPLAFDAAEGKVKLSVGNTTTVTADKLEVKVDPNGGLQGTTNGIVIKPVASGPVTVDANGVNVRTFTAPTANAPGKAGLVPGPEATPENEQLNRFLSAKGGWDGIDLCALHPTAQSAELNKVLLDLGGVSKEGLNIDTLTRSGFFFANSFAGTLPDGITGGALINIMSIDDNGLYYGQQIFISYTVTRLYFRGNVLGIQPGGTVSWNPWSCLTPIPQAAAGVGQWKLIWNGNAGGPSISLPAGGVWSYYIIGGHASGIIVSSDAGVAGGGTLLTLTNSEGTPISSISGVVWRVA